MSRCQFLIGKYYIIHRYSTHVKVSSKIHKQTIFIRHSVPRHQTLKFSAVVLSSIAAQSSMKLLAPKSLRLVVEI